MLGPFARRKRPVISCRECHRRKEKCDRRQPCTRCITRGKRVRSLSMQTCRSLRKQHACLYELNSAPALSASIHGEPDDQRMEGVPQTTSDTISAASSVVEDDFRRLGYADDKKGTPGIVQSLGEPTSLGHHSRSCNDTAADHYGRIIRDLPPRRHIDILVQAFFQNVAWHYDIVDEAAFTAQLSQWRSLSHKQLKSAPKSLPASLIPFPALLFQVLAQALLFQPVQHDKILDDLKYTADMELSDRAAEYSDAGHRLASSFRKSELSLSIVQAELMRACFEKTSGAVIEAWHTLGIAIRDAQELGLHLIEPKHTPYSRHENSDHDLGGKVWLMLHLWDAHMAIILGRPMSTRMSPDSVPFPAPCDCISSALRSPQPCDVILCGYHTAYKFLQDIRDLERIDDCRFLVENIHEALLTNIANLPAWARAQRSHPREPPWLTAALEVMFTNVYFVLFALHRPFVFVEPSSRSNAFDAAMQILESQARLFDKTEPLQYRAFIFVFGTFDALVLIVAVHIRFPDEFAHQLPTTKTNVEWALDRLCSLQASNKLASSAFNVVQRLYDKMLAVCPPTQSECPYHGVSGGENFVDNEADMSLVSQNDFFQDDVESMLPPQPLNELLCNGSFSIHSAWEAEPSYGLEQDQFDFIDSF